MKRSIFVEAVASAAAAAKRCAPEGCDILVRTHKKKKKNTNTNIRSRGDIDFLKLNLRPHKFCCCIAIRTVVQCSFARGAAWRGASPVAKKGNGGRFGLSH